MNEKEIIYNLILDIWNLLKKNNFKKLNDQEWGALAEESLILEEKYKKYGLQIWLLYREILIAVNHYYKSKK